MLFYEIIKREKFLLENGIQEKNSLLIVIEGAFEFSFDEKNKLSEKMTLFSFPKI